MYFPYSIDLSTGTAGGMARLKTEVNGPCFFFSVLAGDLICFVNTIKILSVSV